MEFFILFYFTVLACDGWQIPNGLGSLFAIAQLVLYATFYKSTKRQIAERKANGGMTEVVVMGDGRKVGNGPPLYNSRAAEISGDT